MAARARARAERRVGQGHRGRRRVSRQLVYFHYGSRAGLLTAMARHRDEASGFARAVAAGEPLEDAPARLVRLPARDAAGSPRARGGAGHRRRGRQRLARPDGRAARGVRARARGAELAPGWTVDTAADWIWARVQPSTYAHLVGERGWTHADYTERTVASVLRECGEGRRGGGEVPRGRGLLSRSSPAPPRPAGTSAGSWPPARSGRAAAPGRARPASRRARRRPRRLRRSSAPRRRTRGQELPVGAPPRSTAVRRPPQNRSCCWRTMPSEALSSSSTLTGSSSSTAVASSCTFIRNEPSPETHTTGESGRAACAPSAAGRPKPIVPSPPLVIQRRGGSKRRRLAAHIWCWPTSVVTIASPSAASSASSAARSTRRARRARLVAASRGSAPTTRRARAGASASNSRLSPPARASRRPRSGRATGTFLPISVASMSMCTTFASRCERVKLTGHAVVEARADGDDRSASSIAQFAARVPCMPSMPSQRRSEAGNAPSAISVASRQREAPRERAQPSDASAWTTPPPA